MKNNLPDTNLIALAYDNEARVYVATTTKLVKRAQKIHQTLPTATAAFGRFLTVSAMMSLMYKNERLTLKIDSDGPIGQMQVEANFGRVRGFITNPNVYLVKENKKLDVGKAVGSGHLFITRDYKQKYFTSSTPLQTGEIGDDFTYYFASSEQTPSAVGLSVLTKKDKVLVAGGFIIQLLPNASEETISKIESIIANNFSVTDILSQNDDPHYLLEIITNNTYNLLEEIPLKYHCGCNKKGFIKGLSSLDVNILQEMLDEDKGIEVVCPYCLKKYFFDEKDLTDIINKKLAK